MKNGQPTGNSPVKVSLKKGYIYSWCTCGKSFNQPYYDGKHFGSEFKPLLFTADKTKVKNICICKQTNIPPFCDGSHNK